MPPAIVAHDLTRTYGDMRAVDQISLSIPSGQCFGLLGHNGAGKTTMIRMLTCRTNPTSGSAQVLGHDVVTERNAIRPHINVVFDEQNLHPRLTGRATMRFWGQLYGVSDERDDDLLALVGLDANNDTQVKDWSTGMRQRLIIARALINKPDVLFLDEPTRGLDPASARSLREVVDQLRENGTTVFLTTHDMYEAEGLCDRVAFMSSGSIIAEGTPHELRTTGIDHVSADVVLTDESTHRITLDNEGDAARLREWITAGHIRTLHTREPTLADVFVQIAGRPLHDLGDTGDTARTPS